MGKNAKSVVLGLVMVTMLFLAGCGEREEVTEINLFEKKNGILEPKVTSAGVALRIGVSPMFSPRETLASYEKLVDYIGERMGRPSVLRQRHSYHEINDMLRSQQLDCAFICGGAYIKAKEEGYVELLAVPVVRGSMAYHSYIIVPRESKDEEFRQLEGKVFAFTDPLSNTGRLVPEFMLLESGHTPDSFFSSWIYSYSHDRSIELVSNRRVDGAAVDSLVWEFMDAKGSRATARTKIITKSPPYGIPPVVVPKALDSALKDELRRTFLTLHSEEKGKEILGAILMDRFSEGSDDLYDSIRAMRKSIDERKALESGQ